MKFRHIVVAALTFGVVVVVVVMPRLGWAPTRSHACANNLKALYTFSMLYADKRDRYFPHDPNGSIATLQLLPEAFPDDLRSEHFICPGGEEPLPAAVDGGLILTPESCSYEAVPWRLSLGDLNAILYYEKKPRHQSNGEKLRNVALTDGSVRLVEEDAFRTRFEADRKRFATSTTEIIPNRP